MKEINRRGQGISTFGQQTQFTLGVVKNNHDPAHHGRLQVYIPSLDNEDFKVADLPWALHVSPFAGVTANPIVGRENLTVPGLASYGQWMIPKNGAQVLIGFLDGNPEMRFWLGCTYVPEYNRTMPGYVEGLKTELDDTGLYPQQEVAMLKDNLVDAGLYKTDEHYKTRGGYERSISHPSNKNRVKPTDNGYAPNPLDKSKADSQTYVPLRTPGGHYAVMSDIDEYCRIRLKTIAGNQVIFDDTNERIYLSTAKGRNWVELDETNGKIYIFSDSKVSLRARNDINLYSDENISIVANKRLNLVSEERAVTIQAKHEVTALSTESNVRLTASRDVCITTTNGPKAPRLAVEEICEKPGWHQPKPVGKGYIYRWEEPGGSATSSIRFDAAQNVESVSKDDTSFLAGKAYDLKVGKTIRITSGDDLSLKSGSSFHAQATSDMSLSATSDVKIQSGLSVSLLAGVNVSLQSAAVISLLTSTFLFTSLNPSVPMSMVAIDPDDPDNPDLLEIVATGTGAGAAAAKPASPASLAKSTRSTASVGKVDVKQKMILPDHESWKRDIDEPKCKTPRGPKYKG